MCPNSDIFEIEGLYLGHLANIVPGHARKTKKTISPENITKRDYKYSTLKVLTETMQIIVWKYLKKKSDFRNITQKLIFLIRNDEMRSFEYIASMKKPG